MLIDRFDRPIENLRISVTDRCDLRCFYCIPDEDIEWLPRGEILTLEEIARVASVAVREGIRRIRLTGGEPLMRKGLEVLIEKLHAILGLEDVALTTNATTLARKAEALYAAWHLNSSFRKQPWGLFHFLDFSAVERVLDLPRHKLRKWAAPVVME